MDYDELRLRAPEPKDIHCLYDWENDESLWKFGSTRAPFSYFQLDNFLKNYNNDPFAAGQLRLMVDDIRTSSTIGVVDLYEIDVYNLKAFVGILVDSKHRNKGVATKVLNKVEEYCANTLGLHQLVAYVAVDNAVSVRLFTNSGYVVVACLRDWIRERDSFKDVALLQKIL